MVKDGKNLVVGLDIGTSKIVAIVVRGHVGGRLNVIGWARSPRAA
jgi:cell division ATPase FtsA